MTETTADNPVPTQPIEGAMTSEIPQPLARGGKGGWAALLAGALLVGLAACESTSTSEAEAPADTAEQTASVQDGVVQERLTTADCQQPSEDKVFFQVGGSVFAVPGGEVDTVVPPGVTPETPAEEVIGRLRTATAEGAGCPEKPLELALLAVSGPQSDALLAETILLFRSDGIAGPYGDLTRQMLASPERCQSSEGGLIACHAVEQDGAEEMHSLYLVSTDRNQKLAFGGPLAARCMLAEDRIMGCEILDELEGRIGMRAPLRALPESSAALAAAHRTALERVRPLRR